MRKTMVTGKAIRELILEHSYRAGVGHIGSNLSIADIIATLYSQFLNCADSDAKECDAFILSKGHAALALYAALYLYGDISRESLDTFCQDGTRLGVHPEYQLRGVEFSTGSLGMGLSYAVGMALALRLQDRGRKVYVLLSDGECNEGSTWEGAMVAAHQGLDHLTALVDVNGQQALGYTREVIGNAAATPRWSAFGWDAVEVDGHDVAAMAQAIRRPRDGRPRVLLCRTIFGRGVSFMEGKIAWHYLPVDDTQFAQALQDIERLA